MLAFAFGLVLFALPQSAVLSQAPPVPLAPASASEAGLSFIQHFSPKNYLHLTGNIEHTSLIQDARGVMAIGSRGGVLLYNGNSWQFVETPNHSLAWSMALDANGRMYVGAEDELGYLETDHYGKTRFVSLLSKLPAPDRALGIVWSTLYTPEGIYFKTNHHLLRLKDNAFKIWKTEQASGGMHWIDGKIYLQVYGQGISVLNGERLEPYYKGPELAQSRIWFMQPLDGKRWLIGADGAGLLFFDGRKTSPVPKPVSDLASAYRFHQAVPLPDGTLALAGFSGGIVITDRAGNLKNILNEESGLASNTIYGLCLDNQNGLWMTHEEGLSRVRLGSVFSFFNPQNGLVQQTYAMTEHQGRLYAGTADGLFVLEPRSGPGTPATFRKMEAPSIWQLQSFGGSMLVASNEGLFAYRDGSLRPLPLSDVPWENFARDMEPSATDSNRLFVATKGLAVFRRSGDDWRKEGMIPGLDENVNQVLQAPSGDLWLHTQKGVVRVGFPKNGTGEAPADFFKQVVITRFGPGQGIPAGIAKLSLVGEELVARIGETAPRMYRYREDRNRFEPVTDYGAGFGLPGQLVHPAAESSRGASLWLWTKKPAEKSWQLKRVRKEPGGTYAVQHFDFNGVTDPLKHFFHEQPGRAAWFSGTDGLVRFAYPEARNNSGSFRALLESVVLPSDSVLYPGSREKAELSFGLNSLRFRCAATSYNGADHNQFGYWLEGFERGWSAWTPAPFKEYTQLPEGTYTFHVRAVNAQGEQGVPSQYTFTILPPWYRTGLMYVVYLVGVGAAVYGLVRWRSARLEAEKAGLEKVVAQRTVEIAAQNETLGQQAEELAMQTEKLKELDEAKSRFFANISHEFRTPLTLILSPLLDKLALLHRQPAATGVTMRAGELEVMSRNARRLLQLINQLLDLSKLESGKMPLALQPGDLKALLNIVHASFSSLAEHQRIGLTLQLPDEPLRRQYDEDKLEKVLYNLLSNAIKFTPEGGEVRLQAATVPDAARPHVPAVQITVRDNGRGMTADELERVFNRFYQGKRHYADAQGTGIGLALTRELVELHGGHIGVESRPGEGTAFTVTLPLLPAADVAPVTVPTATGVTGTTGVDGGFTNDSGAADAEAIAFSPVDGERPLVLLVEDNDDLRTYMRNHLSGTYRVIESGNGAQGLAMALDLMPDLVLSDWMMPEMDGIELCERMKTDARTSHIPVILLTALTAGDSRRRGLETGADEYLTKPFDPAELHLRVGNLLENRRRQRDYFSREIRLEPTQAVVASADEKFLRRVMQIVEERMGDSDFSVEEFSREAGLSRVHLHRKLKALTDQAPGDFVRMMRLKRAAQLLDARAGNIAEIAYQVGFNNLSYFSKCFREQFGVLPNEYIKQKAGA
jgi:signal transduction histidine kinase/DNA-binding response OmpR family regulator/ligand-binding sensor domain-containing protein